MNCDCTRDTSTTECDPDATFEVEERKGTGVTARTDRGSLAEDRSDIDVPGPCIAHEEPADPQQGPPPAGHTDAWARTAAPVVPPTTGPSLAAILSKSTRTNQDKALASDAGLAPLGRLSDDATARKREQDIKARLKLSRCKCTPNHERALQTEPS